MQTSTAQGRYYLVERPQASPGCCTICGYSGPDRSYLDPRLDFEFYGSVYFCNECMASMAEMMGFIEPAAARTLELRVQEAERELIHLRAAALAVEDFKRAIGVAVGANVDAPSLLYSNESVVSHVIEGQQELPYDTVDSEGSNDSGLDEQVDESGRDDVRDSNSGKFDLDFI